MVTLQSPQFSFVQFGESSYVQSCNFSDIHLCLPVFEASDVWFQFVISGTEEEIDDLCTLDNDQVTVAIAEDCAGDPLLTFTEKPERYRIALTQVLYLWREGLPDFDTVIDVEDCFVIKVLIDPDYEFCSNCFQRVGETCHTSVVEYGSDENGFDFNYCFSGAVDEEASDCDPTFISFSNEATLNIPYTASLQAKYGSAPSVKTWIYDPAGTGELINAGVREAFDTYPPTEIRIDLGGPASGIIRISK